MPRKSSSANAPKRSDNNVRRVIGANIKARRLALDWNQQELADRFGVSRSAISQYEIGTGEVNAGDLPRLGGILGLSLSDFYRPSSRVSLGHDEKTPADTPGDGPAESHAAWLEGEGGVGVPAKSRTARRALTWTKEGRVCTTSSSMGYAGRRTSTCCLMMNFVPVSAEDVELLAVFQSFSPEERRRALRVIRALQSP